MILGAYIIYIYNRQPIASLFTTEIKQARHSISKHKRHDSTSDTLSYIFYSISNYTENVGHVA